MQNFSLIKNPIITATDILAAGRELPKPLKNSLKTLIKVRPSTFYGASSSQYNKKISFDIPRTYDNLAQLYLKCTLTTATASLGIETGFAAKIFSDIRLKTKNGLVLQSITPRYTLARIDELITTQLYTYLNLSIEPQLPLTTTLEVFVPLFFFFSEDEICFLETRSLEQLELECTVNANKEVMGLDVEITASSYELYMLYHDTNESSKITDLSYTTKPKLTRQLMASYDIFREDQVTCASGSTSAKLLLRCNKPLYLMHLALIDANSIRAQIKTMKIVVGGVDMVDLDYRINFQMYGSQVSFLESGTTSYWFSKLQKRYVDSGLIIFSDQMMPSYLEITYDALPAEYTLYVTEECRTSFDVAPDGRIQTSSGQSTLDQLNSSVAAATLTG